MKQSVDYIFSKLFITDAHSKYPEFISSHPHGHIVGTEGFADRIGHSQDRLVSCLVAIGIINLFEMVDIQKMNRTICALVSIEYSDGQTLQSDLLTLKKSRSEKQEKTVKEGDQDDLLPFE